MARRGHHTLRPRPPPRPERRRPRQGRPRARERLVMRCASSARGQGSPSLTVAVPSFECKQLKAERTRACLLVVLPGWALIRRGGRNGLPPRHGRRHEALPPPSAAKCVGVCVWGPILLGRGTPTVPVSCHTVQRLASLSGHARPPRALTSTQLSFGGGRAPWRGGDGLRRTAASSPGPLQLG